MRRILISSLPLFTFAILSACGGSKSTEGSGGAGTSGTTSGTTTSSTSASGGGTTTGTGGGTTGAGVTAVAVGIHSCAVTSGDKVYCMGTYHSGALGQSLMTDQDKPVLVPGLSGVKQIAVGDSGNGSVTCAIMKDASLQCFGANYAGQLGTGATDMMDHPTPVKVMTDVVQVAIARYGGETLCAVKTDGTLWCWGDNRDSQLGTGKNDAVMHPKPQQIPGMSGVKQVAVGQGAVCAVKGDGTVWCWGSDINGECGVAPASLPDCHQGGDPNGMPFKCVLSPKQVAGVAAAQKVVMGYRTAHVLKTDGSVVGWGENGSGDIGVGNDNDGPMAPTALPGLTASDLASAGNPGGDSTCALGKDGSVSCWGSNSPYAQLGENPIDIDHENAPKKVTLPGPAITIDQNITGAAILMNGQLWGWGNNNNGQLGLGDGADTHVSPAEQIKL